jgi:hypothetical protein
MQQIADWRFVRVRIVLPRTVSAQVCWDTLISVAAQPHLTDQAFKDIGVLLGQRRILLAAIGELAGAHFKRASNAGPEGGRR